VNRTRLALLVTLGLALTSSEAWGLSLASAGIPRVQETAAADSSGAEVRRLRALKGVEQLVVRGRSDDAAALLEQYLRTNGYDRVVVRRLVRLYRDTRQFAKLEKLLTQEISHTQEEDVGSLRLLAQARFELGQDKKAMATLQRILDAHKGEISYSRMVAMVLGSYRHDEEALEVLLEARKKDGHPYALAQPLGAVYLRLRRPLDAVREYLNVILDTPQNVDLMRAQILDIRDANPESAAAMLELTKKVYAQHPSIPQVGLVLAELEQLGGDNEGAWQVLEPLLNEPRLMSNLLQLAMAGLAESRLPGSDSLANLRHLMLSRKILDGLLQSDRLPQGLQPRAYDALTRTWLALLASSKLDELPAKDQAEFLTGAKKSLLDMSERFPNDAHTTKSLLRLAKAYVEWLHKPKEAIALFRRIELNPNANVDDVEMARVGLGQAYMAAGDTSSARSLFETMGKDMNFVEGQGRAHYHLGELDFMGGDFERAKDRLSAVAFESPTASYTNDALDLALLLAEEKMGKDDEQGLRRYGRALYWRTVGRSDSLVTELTALTKDSSPVLRTRARLDLAQFWSKSGKTAKALGEIESLLSEDSGSRLAPRALELKGDLLAASGKTAAARAAYEQLLESYDDYIFLDEVRGKLRALDSSDKSGKGDLP
jgi:tetratricopeptide (TPR) repeat protein